jgi:hypothetical protein
MRRIGNMQDIDIDQIMKIMASPEAAKNAAGLMDMLNELNRVLGTLQKTMNMLESMGLKPLLVRAAGAKLGVDAETPLQSESSERSIIASSEYHSMIFRQLNDLPPNAVAQILDSGIKIGGKLDEDAD